MAPHSEKMKMIRVVVREDFTKSRCDALIADFKLALQTLDSLDAKKIQENKEYASLTLKKEDFANTYNRHQFAMRRRSTLVSPVFKKAAADLFTGEEHSLQGKTGKTHAVC